MATVLQARAASFPRLLRHCPRCREATPHQISDGMVICVHCIERAVNYQLDRD